MYADPRALLHLADDLRARGEDLRDLAHDLAREATAVDWQGLSAEAMRGLVGVGREHLLELAGHHDHVARLVTVHARHVADRLGLALDVIGVIGVVEHLEPLEHAGERVLDWLGHAA